MTIEPAAEVVARIIAEYEAGEPLITIIWSSADVVFSAEVFGYKEAWTKEDTQWVIQSISEQMSDGYTVNVDTLDDCVLTRAKGQGYVSTEEEEDY